MALYWMLLLRNPGLALMSFCSLETLVFQPLGLSRAGCALLSACLAQP